MTLPVPVGILWKKLGQIYLFMGRWHNLNLIRVRNWELNYIKLVLTSRNMVLDLDDGRTSTEVSQSPRVAKGCVGLRVASFISYEDFVPNKSDFFTMFLE